jgi:golgi-specific brefeldin A-resistance guanine nucleotide exchange factor 1
MLPVEEGNHRSKRSRSKFCYPVFHLAETDLRRESPTVNRGVKAINIILHLTSRIPDLIQQSHLERNEAWAAYWSPIFRALSAQCVNPCREIRHKAIATLQRTLLSSQLATEDHAEWIAIFGEVLFPLVLRLLKPEVYKLDQVGMSETRIQAATLCCKIFLRYLDELARCGQMLDVWLRILDILDRMMNSGQGDALEEAVPESLKNILLVMGGAGYLSPPSENPENEKTWTETKKRLDRFLPDLFSDVFPERKDEIKSEKENESDATVGQMDGNAAERASVENQ